MGKLKSELIEENKMLLERLNRLEKLMESATKTETKEQPGIIPMNKIVKVVSLYHGILNLKTSNSNNATIFKFNQFGDEIPMFYSDLVKCISNQQRFFKDGFVMILDEEVVKAHYLQEHYKDLLTREKIESFLDNSATDIEHIFPILTVQQKMTVLESVARKLNNKKIHIDRNKVDILARISKVNLDELAEKLKL